MTARALAAIHGEPAHAWTVEDLGAAAGLSRAAFARRFTAVAGEPPLAYLTRRRTTLATRLLRDTDKPLGQVASAIGYGSAFALAESLPARIRHHSGGVPPSHAGGQSPSTAAGLIPRRRGKPSSAEVRRDGVMRMGVVGPLRRPADPAPVSTASSPARTSRFAAPSWPATAARRDPGSPAEVSSWLQQMVLTLSSPATAAVFAGATRST
ncbi:helix-turn-helix domain-containing protein [Amycolatopsis sp. FDAARGOS 1241]|uniref:helix-turn-helix domain-containing protein n=1 Tax=Amycolatopsis sp. FDAARGOS 1241 TaxID=2778070 RepID=UPI00194E4CBD|nr:helix-turn-helix transcriptional regulator [Amycolatopsis sp. FDAARGOS 1241]